MAFFRKKSSSVQDKIESLKKRQVEEHLDFDIPDALPAVIPEASPEERKYLDSLEQSLNGGKSILSIPGKRPRSPMRGPRPAVKIVEEEVDDYQDDPFSLAEREVESMVRQGQSMLEKRRQHEAQPEVSKPVIEPEAIVATQTPPPEIEPAPETIRQTQVDSSYDEIGNLPFPPGTIVRLNDDSLGIIKQEIPNREYDLVYILTAEGKVEPRGVCLFAFGIERLGRLPKEELGKVENKMEWTRDHLIYYLDDVKLTRHIPHPTVAVEKGKEKKHARFDDGKSLIRGRTLSINFGDKKWEAVFWAEDSMGTLVAHNQQGEWELLQMDLKRFGSSLKTGKLLQGDELKKIEEAVIARHAGK